jgi:hypothetical protein
MHLARPSFPDRWRGSCTPSTRWPAARQQVALHCPPSQALRSPPAAKQPASASSSMMTPTGIGSDDTRPSSLSKGSKGEQHRPKTTLLHSPAAGSAELSKCGVWDKDIPQLYLTPAAHTPHTPHTHSLSTGTVHSRHSRYRHSYCLLENSQSPQTAASAAAHTRPGPAACEPTLLD